MKTINLRVLAMCGVMLLTLGSCKNEKKTEQIDSETPQETIVKNGERSILFENDYAKVVKVSLAPGESQPAHEGENRVIYSLTDYSIDWKEKGEDLGTKTWKKGDAHFHEAGKHAATNNGTTTAEWLVFIKRSTDLPECGENKIENDVSSVSAEFVKVLLDNDEFKLTEVTLPKGANIPMHSGINRIIYSLTDYQIMYESNKEGKVEKAFKTGDIHWHEACMHSLENLGQTEAKYLVVSYKKK
jgi:quercetin dioxygenase-like cupin family protein